MRCHRTGSDRLDQRRIPQPAPAAPDRQLADRGIGTVPLRQL
jgi:hypothetical protein